MPTFQLDGPDGGTYELDAPDAQTAVAAFRKSNFGAGMGGQGGGAPPAPGGDQQASDTSQQDDEARIAANDPGYIKGIASHLAQGATFGLSDEILAGVKSGAGFLGDYGQALQHERDISHGFEEAHPIISALSEIVGSLPTAGGIARAGGSLVVRSAEKAAARGLAAKAAGETVGKGEQLLNVGKRIGAGAAEGGAYGAAYGAGESDGGVGDRAQGALGGGLLGAATGGALSAALPAAQSIPGRAAVGGAIGAAGGALVPGSDEERLRNAGIGAVSGAALGHWRKNVVAGRDPATEASGRIGAALPDTLKVADRIGAAGRVGQELGIADVGGAPAEDMLKTAAMRAGDRGAAAKTADLSELSARDRIKTLLSTALNAPEGAYQAATDMVARARSSDPNVARLYDRFNKSTVPPLGDPLDPKSMAAVLDTPAGRRGLAAAKEDAANERKPWAGWFQNNVTPNGQIKVGAIPTPEALDAVRSTVQGAYQKAKTPPINPLFGKPTENHASTAIKTVLDDLTGHMDAIGESAPGKADGFYAQAREAAGGNIRADEALEFGRNALTTDPRVIAQRMGDPAAYGRERVFTSDERELSRIGLASDIFSKLDKTESTEAALKQFFRSPAQVAKIKPFFNTDVEFKAFQQQMLAESLKGRSNTIVQRATGSPRIVNPNEAAGDLNKMNVGKTFLMWGPHAGLMSAVRGMLSRVGGMTPKVADEIGKQLMTRDPEEVRQIFRRIHALERTKLTQTAKRIRTRQLVTAATAGAAGRSMAAPEEPPIANARKAKDGNWYIPDLARQGKYLQVVH